jgi:hypothetical protein
MKFQKNVQAIFGAVALSLLGISSAFAGGVASYTGTVSSTNAAISSGAGSSAVATINLDFRVPNFIGLGVYDTAGANANALFSSPGTAFTTTTFTAAESVSILTANETNLNSKFDLDGTTSTTDATTIMNAINATANAASQDIIIKGATFTNAAAATPLSLATSVASVTMTGGTGSAPIYALRSIGGIPGAGATAINTSTTPNTTPLSLTSARRTAGGYSRFAIVGDLSETSVTSATKGNWTGSFTITLTGI